MEAVVQVRKSQPSPTRAAPGPPDVPRSSPEAAPSLRRFSPSTRAVSALWKREVLKFVRDRSRLVGAFAQPVAFWVLLGFGFGGTFQMPEGIASDMGYLEFLFPGVVALVVLFTAIFSTISIVEERRAGFLQATLVAPASRTALVLGNALGGTTLAVVQAALFLCALPLVGIWPSLAGLGLALVTTALLALGFTALGFVMAWRVETTRGFHGLMNVVLMPLWFLSGAVFPVEGTPRVLGWLMRVNPVTYGVELIRDAIYLPEASSIGIASIPVSLGVTAAFALAMLALAAKTAQRPVFG